MQGPKHSIYSQNYNFINNTSFVVDEQDEEFSEEVINVFDKIGLNDEHIKLLNEMTTILTSDLQGPATDDHLELALDELKVKGSRQFIKDKWRELQNQLRPIYQRWKSEDKVEVDGIINTHLLEDLPEYNEDLESFHNGPELDQAIVVPSQNGLNPGVLI